MVPINEANVVEKGALGPGQMIGVHMGKGALYHDEELKDKMAAALPFGEWVGKINELDSDLGAVTEAPLYTGGELRKRQIAAGYTIEELENILAPMAEDAKEALASMGDDTPSAVLSVWCSILRSWATPSGMPCRLRSMHPVLRLIAPSLRMRALVRCRLGCNVSVPRLRMPCGPVQGT